MARALSENTRLVFTGPTTNPDKCWAEYRVANGELFEDSKRLDFNPLPSLATQSSTYWTARIGEVKTEEGIT